MISTHASLAGRDQRVGRRAKVDIYFNPRVPCGTRRGRRAKCNRWENFNPRVPCGTRLYPIANQFHRVDISTHASLAGRDTILWFAIRRHCDFNPRVPCGTRRAADRGAHQKQAISTHASLAGRDLRGGSRREQRLISTHASLAGRDDSYLRSRVLRPLFQPTRPLRDATRASGSADHVAMISTHASLAGRDDDYRGQRLRRDHFNPRVPCGTRPAQSPAPVQAKAFQPTRPLRDATVENKRVFAVVVISTHASLAGRDISNVSGGSSPGDFNPRVPCGTRRCTEFA